MDYYQRPDGSVPRVVMEIDGVLAGAPDKGKTLFDCPPLPDGVLMAQRLAKAGVHIVIHSSRPESERDRTERWLEKWKVEVAELVLGAPSGDAYLNARSYPVKFWPRLDARDKGIANLLDGLLTGELK
jgi:hypothetical protein